MAMKTREEVIALFRDKYAYLKALCQHQIGPFNASAIYQNPDGGWQLNLEQPGTDCKAAITLRPNDEVPHETHGVIGARWFQEGGAFDKNGIPGRLGYPVEDERPTTITRSRGYADGITAPVFDFYLSGMISTFEFGTIEYHNGLTFGQLKESLMRGDYGDNSLMRAYLQDETDFEPIEPEVMVLPK